MAGYFFVEEGYRSRGLGAVLMDAALAWLERCRLSASYPFNYRLVRLVTLRGIYEAAFDMYLRRGFRVTETRRTPFFEVVFMEKEL